MSAKKRRFAQCFPPGEFISEELEARGWSVLDLAQRARPTHKDSPPGPSVVELSAIIHNQAPLSDWYAQRIAKAFGTSIELWINLEDAYRSWLDSGKGVS